MPGIRMAKADEKDFETTHDFFNKCEMFWDNRNRFSFKETESEWLEYEDDDPDKIELLKIRKELSLEEGCSESQVDNRLIVYEYIKKYYKRCDCNWRRVTFAAQILIPEVCDPQKDHLELHVAPEM